MIGAVLLVALLAVVFLCGYTIGAARTEREWWRDEETRDAIDAIKDEL